MEITFLQTGGTIDKDYPIKAGSYAFEIKEPAISRIMEIVKPNFEYEVLSVLRKDSLEISDSDRELIYQVCLRTKSQRIVVTHGTDTMLETAKKLSKLKGKVIVLTGSLIPERFRDSDAMFNVGTAIGALNFLRSGVFVAMNGRIYPWDQCKKDLRTAIFVAS